MWLKLSIITILLFVFAAVKNSFLPHVPLFGVTPDLVFVLFFVSIFFESSSQSYEGIFITLVAGFLLDVFSSSYFGVSMVALLLVYGAVKIVMHFLKEGHQDFLVAYFIPIFLVSLICYSVLLSVAGYFLGASPITYQRGIFLQLAINLIMALIGFFIYEKCMGKNERQLTLF